jgi:hypothetical protein
MGYGLPSCTIEVEIFETVSESLLVVDAIRWTVGRVIPSGREVNGRNGYGKEEISWKSINSVKF